ncbi:hypothetical protein DKT77_15115 [Meridianimarinicoccus roseus]|jgi:Spy/CpxP family protein refolding chaperone|uniref:Uncharacterized protein n=1 Tax=Meridianimarinicoccus roseus TaxID=2072018 RepID=A0A2V2L9F7_9RHOB|nr:hypothetical protein [Meridianimarinicoccus roseus]PWR01915.1 hypothetical protein DKT77_15115 [Meridianimarinicoccus roseus]
MGRPLVGLFVAAALAGPVAASDAPYAGQQTRGIAALSDADIAAIEAGEGWGLALPAELNGWPGPAHVLEMASDLALTEHQHAVVTRIFGIMRDEARRVGARYIETERALDAAFEDPSFDPVTLAGLTAASANALGELRTIHLAAHIETRQVLNRHQIMTYNTLRGYAGDGAHGGHSSHGAQ